MVAVASGLVLFLAFPDVGWWVTAPVAFAAFYMLLARVSTRGGFGFGWIMGMAFFLPHLWWAYVAVGPVPWIALSGAESIAFGLVGALFARLTRSELLASSSMARARGVRDAVGWRRALALRMAVRGLSVGESGLFGRRLALCAARVAWGSAARLVRRGADRSPHWRGRDGRA